MLANATVPEMLCRVLGATIHQLHCLLVSPTWSITDVSGKCAQRCDSAAKVIWVTNCFWCNLKMASLEELVPDAIKLDKIPCLKVSEVLRENLLLGFSFFMLLLFCSFVCFAKWTCQATLLEFMYVAKDQCCPSPWPEKLPSSVVSGQCGDSQLIKVLRISDDRECSPEWDDCIAALTVFRSTVGEEVKGLWELEGGKRAVKCYLPETPCSTHSSTHSGCVCRCKTCTVPNHSTVHCRLGEGLWGLLPPWGTTGH